MGEYVVAFVLKSLSSYKQFFVTYNRQYETEKPPHKGGLVVCMLHERLNLAFANECTWLVRLKPFSFFEIFMRFCYQYIVPTGLESGFLLHEPLRRATRL